MIPTASACPTLHRLEGHTEDFERFFAGLAVDVRRTVSGLDQYPPDPYAASALRERFGRFAYELFAALDDLLLEKDADLLAKHWAVSAHPGNPGLPRPRTPSGPRRTAPVGPSIRGAYDVLYSQYTGPTIMRAGARVLASVGLRHQSWQVWRSDVDPPVMTSYHWCRANGEVLGEGERTALPRPVQPGDELEAALRIVAPEQAGRYLLWIDLVHEGVTWFSVAGSPALRVRVKVK